MPTSTGSSRPRDQTHLSISLVLAGGFFTTSATWEALYMNIWKHKNICIDICVHINMCIHICIHINMYTYLKSFPHSSVSKESACNAGDPSLIPGSGRYSGEVNGNPLQYSYLENPMDRGVWWATVHGITRVGHDLSTKPSPPYIFICIDIFIYLLNVNTTLYCTIKTSANWDRI